MGTSVPTGEGPGVAQAPPQDDQTGHHDQEDFLPDFDASADFLSTLSLFSTLPVSTLFGKLCSLNHDRISFHHNNRREHCILSTSFCFRYHLH